MMRSDSRPQTALAFAMIAVSFAFMLFAAAFAGTADFHLSGLARLSQMIRMIWNVALISLLLLLGGVSLLPCGNRAKILVAVICFLSQFALFDLWPAGPRADP